MPDEGPGTPYRAATAPADDFRDFAASPKERPSARAVAVIVAVTLGVLWLDLERVPWRVEACLSLIGLPIGLFILDRARSRRATSRRLLGASCTSTREASGGGVAIRGRVLASELGPLVSPPSGRAVVWTRVDVLRDGAEGLGRIASETAARDFQIDDGSGELAYVVAHGARFLPDNLKTRRITELEPRLRAFLEARGLESAHAVDEHVFEPGDEIIAVGPSRRVSVAAKEGEAATASRLVLAAGGRSAGELLVAAWPPSANATPAFVLALGAMGIALGVAPIVLSTWWYFAHPR